MNSPLADPRPGAKSPGIIGCRSLPRVEAGVPIDLDAIRDKDEKYWNDYKGTPKAFISTEMLCNCGRIVVGDYTAVRYPGRNV